jgi:hypothetical protein
MLNCGIGDNLVEEASNAATLQLPPAPKLACRLSQK